MNYVLDGIMGLCVADALGVPVEFEDRDSLLKNPVVDMRAYGTYNQPAGTWSDDSSMSLCLVDSLSKGLDYNDIMVKFSNWINNGEYTPHGEVFDIGVVMDR
jgi:ADP-ribosylglycohydrolase